MHRPAHGRGRTRKAQQARFLEALRSTGDVTGAVQLTKTSWSTHRSWLNTDPAYAAACTEAHEDLNDELADALLQELRRLALEGTDDPVFWRGEQVAVRKRRSYPALVLLLRATRPALFSDPANIDGEVDDALLPIDPSAVTPDELETLRTLLRKATGPHGETKGTS